MCLRFFAPAVEQIEAEWRERVLTSVAWVEIGRPGSLGGTFGSFPVSGVALGAMAKPRPKKAILFSEHPVAAHEKIASDLAFDLGLPVPPAQLWHRPNLPVSHGRTLVVSAFPFTNPLRWDQVAIIPAVAARVLPLMGAFASAIVPFDTWLMNGDRDNPGNLILAEDISTPVPLLRVAYIDFANSLVRVFRGLDIWKDEKGFWPIYPHGAPVDLQAMSRTVTAIEALSPSEIQKVVERVPPTFLLPVHRDAIVKALLYRQPRLRGIIRLHYPGLP